MAKRLTCEKRKISRVMREGYRGKLKSSSGHKVKDPRQMAAIAHSEARKMCSKR